MAELALSQAHTNEVVAVMIDTHRHTEEKLEAFIGVLEIYQRNREWEIFRRQRHLTTHSTGARVSLSFIVNLSVMQLNVRPVNSSVRRPMGENNE